MSQDVCPACGAAVESDHRECAECGAVLEGATESFAPVAETSEAPVVEVGDAPSLVVRKGHEVGERFYIDRDEFTIGRDPSCDIFLNDVTVSRAHAVIKAAGGVFEVEDVSSLNGTYVNGVRVDSAPLGHGDTLQVGRFVMTFTGAGGTR